MYIIMSNPWITHLKQIQKQNPKLTYKQCMQKGKLSYTKQSGKGQCCGKQTQKVDPEFIQEIIAEAKAHTTPEQRETAKAIARPLAEAKLTRPVGRVSLTNLSNDLEKRLGVSRHDADLIANIHVANTDIKRAERKRKNEMYGLKD